MPQNSLLDDAANSARLGDVNEAVALSQKMDDLLNQLIKVRTTSVLTLQPWDEPTFWATGSNCSWCEPPCWSVFAAQPLQSGLGDHSESVVSHYTLNRTGAYTPYEDSMFAGANNVYISNGTFNIIAGQRDTNQASQQFAPTYKHSIRHSSQFPTWYIGEEHAYLIHANHLFILISRSH